MANLMVGARKYDVVECPHCDAEQLLLGNGPDWLSYYCCRRCPGWFGIHEDEDGQLFTVGAKPPDRYDFDGSL